MDRHSSPTSVIGHTLASYVDMRNLVCYRWAFDLSFLAELSAANGSNCRQVGIRPDLVPVERGLVRKIDADCH